MLSNTPMSPDAFYEAFLAILQVYEFVAVPSGNIIKILPDATSRQLPANDLPDRVSSTSDELVTQVIQVRNVSAAQLVPILRPMMPQSAHLAAYPSVEHADHLGSRLQREPHDPHRRSASTAPATATSRWCGSRTRPPNEIVRVINSLSSAQGAEGAGAAHASSRTTAPTAC